MDGLFDLDDDEVTRAPSPWNVLRETGLQGGSGDGGDGGDDDDGWDDELALASHIEHSDVYAASSSSGLAMGSWGPGSPMYTVTTEKTAALKGLTPTGTPVVSHLTTLTPEVDTSGRIEYKLMLRPTTLHRFEKLVTQLSWRLSQGNGEAVYELGVRDDGGFVGLDADEMENSLQTLRLMSRCIDARLRTTRIVQVVGAQSWTKECAAGRVGTRRHCQETWTRPVPEAEPLATSIETDLESEPDTSFIPFDLDLDLFDLGKPVAKGRKKHGRRQSRRPLKVDDPSTALDDATPTTSSDERLSSDDRSPHPETPSDLDALRPVTTTTTTTTTTAFGIRDAGLSREIAQLLEANSGSASVLPRTNKKIDDHEKRFMVEVLIQGKTRGSRPICIDIEQFH